MTSVYYSVLASSSSGNQSKTRKDLCVAAAKLSDDSSVEILYAVRSCSCSWLSNHSGAKAVEAIKANTGEAAPPPPFSQLRP